MEFLKNMPFSGVLVIVVILALFISAVLLLLYLAGRYKALQNQVTSKSDIKNGGFADFVSSQYIAAYKQYGANTNTPAIINNAFCARLSGLLFCERFMNNAVSLFVTLGLFGTFLGLSLSVSSLTQLISLSSTEEWLSILNSVGGGLISALSGMGVAFYTSLVGVACSILFTVLRTIMNPQVQREKLETMTELWLDHTIAPQLTTEAATDDESRFMQMKEELRAHAAAVEKALTACTSQMNATLTDTTKSLGSMIEYSKEPIGAFYDTVTRFNDNVRDFSEFNYDLRGNIERMDVCFRDLSQTVKQLNKTLSEEGGRRQ
jgi:hypothetical protein